MKVLLDTNIILDVLLNRPGFLDAAKKIFELAERKQFSGFITASAITDIFYISKRQIKNIDIVYQMVDKLTVLFTIAPVSETTIINALALHWKDFEDAIQYVASKENEITHIITRNVQDYKASDILCIEPTAFIKIAGNNC